MRDRAITCGSLFSGVGGLDLGLERAGMRTKWFVEIDPFCRRVLAKHWPDVPCYEDVRDVGAHNLEPVDLIAGGFPCQPVSHAGKRKAQEDERWLWPEFARILGELRSRYALMENVPGLLARGMGDVLGDLAALGYDAEWQCIPAAAVGAPHLRWRVFVIAHRAELRWTLADAGSGWRPDNELQAGRDEPWLCGAAVADAECGRRVRRTTRALRRDGSSSDVGGKGGRRGSACHEWWSVEPDVGRVAHGTANRVDRLRALGNAVVPQVAEYIGRRIMEAHDRPGNQDS